MSAGLRAPRLPLFIAAYSPPRSAPPLASVTIVSNCFNVYVLDCRGESRVLEGKKQKGLKGGNLDMHIHFSYLTWAPQCLRLLGIRDTPGTQPSASVPTFSLSLSLHLLSHFSSFPSCRRNAFCLLFKNTGNYTTPAGARYIAAGAVSSLTPGGEGKAPVCSISSHYPGGGLGGQGKGRRVYYHRQVVRPQETTRRGWRCSRSSKRDPVDKSLAFWHFPSGGSVCGTEAFSDA